jgi:hypothetical protein
MKKLTFQEFAKRLETSKGAQIIGIEALIDARARKTGNPFGAISKHVRAVGFTGAGYEDAVNREGNRQGISNPDFQAEKLPWGEWVIQNKLISHKGELYLRTQSTPGQRRKQAARVLGYKGENGQSLTRDEVKAFLPEVRESAKQQDESGLSETVWVRTYKLANVLKLRAWGQTFQLCAG